MKIGMISLGCPKNLVDSEVMLGLAQGEGHQLTREAADADVLIVNTCAFIDKAKQESIDTILEMAEHKKNGRCSRLVVTGCLAERYRDELIAQIPEIDAVLGTGEVPGIVNAIGPADPQLVTRHPESGLPIVPLLRANGEPVTRSEPSGTADVAPSNPRTVLRTSTTPPLPACSPRRGTTPT